MIKKNLSALLSKINITATRGPSEQTVEGFCVDSRIFKPGQIYFAQKGIHNDGHAYIKDVISRGCNVIVHSDPLDEYVEGVTYVRVDNVRKALSPVSSAFYEEPSNHLTIIGVTGTDGKSSTVSYVFQLFELLHYRAGFFSTVEYLSDTEILKNPFRMSTPEAFEVHRLLREMVENGKEYAVIESTSHGLASANSRLADVQYDVGILTNITHEHLEFHGTIEQYANDKANLFRQIRPSERAMGIIRQEEPFMDTFRNSFDGTWATYSYSDEKADAYAEKISETINGINFTLKTISDSYECFIPLHGRFNINNVVAAALAVERTTRITLKEIVKLFPRLRAVKGRMQAVQMGQPFSAIIDYAHSPGSFEKLLPEVRQKTKGQLIVLFGSAGERDTAKRPIQGEIAGRFADKIILSDEDPRKEDPVSICREIARGCRGFKEEQNLFIIPDRTLGIQKALSIAKPDDTVLFLGKGHESSIIYADGSIVWDEEMAVINGLRKLGFNGT